MALRIKETEYYAIDAHSHLGRRKTPLGHGVASFLGDNLIRDLDEVGLDCAVAFPLGASYTDYSEGNQIMAEEMAKFVREKHITQIIFGHTHQPIPWNDPHPGVFGPEDPIVLRGLSLHNAGGWVSRDGKFCGAEVFLYETRKGFSSIAVR